MDIAVRVQYDGMLFLTESHVVNGECRVRDQAGQPVPVSIRGPLCRYVFHQCSCAGVPVTTFDWGDPVEELPT